MSNFVNSMTRIFDLISRPVAKRHIHVHNNAICHLPDCGKCNAIMLRVGAMIICTDCFNNYFKSDNPVTDERAKYLELLEIYNNNKEKREYKSQYAILPPVNANAIISGSTTYYNN